MSSTDTTELLNDALVILRRSFPQYIRYARPYIPPGREDLMETIEEIVTAQDALIERLSQMIYESGGLPESGRFPIEFTDTHDLEIDFLIEEAIGYQMQDIAKLARCVDALRLAPAAQSLAAEALGMAKGHLEMLEELSHKARPSTKLTATPAFANDTPPSSQIDGPPHRREEPKLAAGEPHSPG